MKKTFLGLFFLCPILAIGQLKYPSYNEVVSMVKGFNTRGLVSNDVIGKSYGNEGIPVIKFQLDNTARPTLLVVAGIDGKDPAGTLSDVQLTKNLLTLPADSLPSCFQQECIWRIP